MAVRSSMTELIDQVRIMINDTGGSPTEMFSDQEIQDSLDQHVIESIYDQLNPIKSVLPGGVVEYKNYKSGLGFYENNAVLCDSSYNAVTAGSSNFISGQFLFDDSVNPPLFIYGNRYDVYMVASELWSYKAAKYADDIPFSADGASYKTDARYQQAVERAKFFRTKSQANGNVYLTRSDVISA